MTELAEIQDHKEAEILKKNAAKVDLNLGDGDRHKAAELIQRNYRGYRERRQIQGMALGMDPTTRWVEAIKEARYRDYTAPKARASLEGSRPSTANEEGHNVGDGPAAQKELARRQWKKVGYIARRAVADEDSSVDSHDGDDDEDRMTEEERAQRKKQREEKKRERQKTAKIMDLQ
jgi:hypothetical protein